MNKNISDNYQESVEKMVNNIKQSSDLELINKFNKEVQWKGWWVSARMSYIWAIHDEFKKRWFDYSMIWNSTDFSLWSIIRLEEKDWNKVIKISDYNDIILKIYNLFRKYNIDIIYEYFSKNNTSISKLTIELFQFLNLKWIEVKNFDKNNIDENIPLLTYWSQSWSPIYDEANYLFPHKAFVIWFSWLSGSISDKIWIYKLEWEEYIDYVSNIVSKDDFKLVFVYKSVYWDNTAGYWIYLINYSDTDYNVYYETNGFISVDEDVYNLDGSENDLKVLNANSRILVEEADIWGLDLSWFVNLTLTGEETIEIDFSIWKRAPIGEKISIEWFKEKGILMDFDFKQI